MSNSKVAFTGTDGVPRLVSPTNPLPVTLGSTAPGVPATIISAGTTSGGQVVPLQADVAGALVVNGVGPSTARAPVTNPTAAADLNQLLRGILGALNTIATNTTPVP